MVFIECLSQYVAAKKSISEFGETGVWDWDGINVICSALYFEVLDKIGFSSN
jgi:hypothetical protein